MISPEEMLSSHKDAIIFLTSGSSASEMKKILIDNGFSEEQIVFGVFTDEQEQYFDPILSFGDDEVFVDAGAYDGFSSVRFAKEVNYKYNKIFVFEPDKGNLMRIANNVEFQKLANTEISSIGLSSKKIHYIFLVDSLVVVKYQRMEI